MDFFEHQDNARKATGWLVFVYVLFVAAILLTIHALVAFAYFYILLSEGGPESSAYDVTFAEVVADPRLVAGSMGVIAAIIGVATIIKMSQLSQGGSSVAKSLNGREILPSTREYRERRLLNVVEEMSLASGVPMPRVFVLDSEPGINAFAAGFSSKDAAIAVTRGTLDLLNRDELQAVVGHEFSHILNGDMRLNIRMIGVLFGILCISLLGNILFRAGSSVMRSSSRSRRKKDNGSGLALGLMAVGGGVWLIGSLGVLCSRIMQAMISRQREFLADVSSVQFTRNPGAMADVLKIIGASANGSRLSNAHASEVSHMLFANGLTMNLFSTHPPLEKRITLIDPGFDGDFSPYVKTIQRRMAMQSRQTDRDDEEDLHRGILAGSILQGVGLEGPGQSLDLPPASIQASVRTPVLSPTDTPPASAVPSGGRVPTPPPAAGSETGWLSDEERESIRTSSGATACLFASLLSANHDLRVGQIDIVTREKGKAFADLATAWGNRFSSMTMQRRRTSCEVAVNTLRVLAKEDIQKIAAQLDKLVYADGQIDAFEFALTRMFRCRLLQDVSNSRRRASSAASLAKPAAFVLHVLANFGTPKREDAVAAWEAGAEILKSFGSLPLDNLNNFNDLTRFDAALRELVRLPPLSKREFMEACEAVAQHDGALTDTEDNFLFAIADVIEATGWNAQKP